MRTVKIVVALVVAVVVLAGCGLLGSGSGRSEDEQLRELMDENASFSVFLRPDATDGQRQGVEAALRALAGFTGLTYTDPDAAYRRLQQMMSAAPDFVSQVSPGALPGSFEVRMTDIAAVQRLRDDVDPIKNLPGVQDVSFVCTTVAECREKFSPRPTAPPS
ncbi:permease-like cell division protein FtsX [Micromonosporaceae bacterium Da 78-11]